jgi:glucose dehydrogenase
MIFNRSNLRFTGRLRYLQAVRILGVVALLAFPAKLRAQTNWPYAGHDPGATRYSPLRQINTKNVTKLRRAWTFHTDDARNDMNSEGAPIVVDDVMYFVGGKSIFALDADTGLQIWKYETTGTERRGLSYWPGDKNTSPRLFLGLSGRRMLALDARTGKPSARFGDNGIVTGVSPSAAPAIYCGLVITGGNADHTVRAWDAHTGKLVWTFYTKAQPGGPGYDTWKGDSWNWNHDGMRGADVWGFITVDEAHGLVYVPIATAGGPDFYGGMRLGNALYTDCVVALDANTGKLVWYQQLVHHDLWDYDLAAAPTLFDFREHGKTVHGLAETTKAGLLFLFDRLNGKPLFGIEERPVPQGNVPGDETSPTQPFPVKPAPFTRNSFKAEDLYNLTPEHAAFCKQLWDKYDFYSDGPYTPYSTTRMTVIYPGREGGGNWGGVAFDPKLGYVFGTSVFTAGQTGKLVKAPHGNPMGGPYEKDFPFAPNRYKSRFWDPSNGWPCVNPPWGTLYAVDVRTADIVWNVPLGTVDALAAKGFPDTGTINSGSMVVTAGGVVFVDGTNDGRFRAFDARTGKALWTVKIDASAHTLPVTYKGRNGKQYVVVEAFGGMGMLMIPGITDERPGDSVIAFTLP